MFSFLYRSYEKLLLRQVKTGQIPQHLGVILDGNRRFAKEHGLPVVEGHRKGAKIVKQLIRWCRELHIPVITLWVFSTQNFSRPSEEVDALMKIFIDYAQEMLRDPDVIAQGIRMRIIGRRDLLAPDVQEAMRTLEEATAGHTGMTVQLALGYGGREEVVDAVRGYLHAAATRGETLAHAAEQFSEASVAKHLYTSEVPDPDFIIRTSGEIRLSGFLLWQAAYSEYYFLDVYWPAFRKIDFLRAIRSYQLRKRRFGK